MPDLIPPTMRGRGLQIAAGRGMTRDAIDDVRECATAVVKRLPRPPPGTGTSGIKSLTAAAAALLECRGPVYLRRRSRTKTCCATTLLAVISSA